MRWAGVTTFTYNANGTVATMTDPKGDVASDQHDAHGNLTRITNPLSRVTQMSYDSVSRRTSLLDAKGQTTTYQYDAINRLTRVTYHDGSYVQFTHDGKVIFTSSEQVAQPYRFAGAYYDTNLGLYKMGGRYYTQWLGRFTQRDPEPGSAYEPLSYNRRYSTYSRYRTHC